MNDDVPSAVSPGLPPRQETFLAHYPRKVKLLATVAILALALAPCFLPHAKKSVEERTAVAPPKPTMAHVATLEGAEKETEPTPNDAAVAKGNDTDDHGARMAKAPDTSLTEDTAKGALPRVAEDGRKVWQAYARPFDVTDKRPRIAIVMTELGFSRVATDAAIQRLPSNVTLAFDVESPVVGSWLNSARQSGHETLLALPMEPFDYPRNDPGPNTLLTNRANSDNIERLDWALRQGTGYVGVTTLSGSRFTTDPEKIKPLLESLKQRGLLALDAQVAPHSVFKDLARPLNVPAAASDVQIDATPTPDSIDAALAQLEQTAMRTGHVVATATPLPVTLDRLALWIKKLPDHGLALAPLSAVVE